VKLCHICKGRVVVVLRQNHHGHVEFGQDKAIKVEFCPNCDPHLSHLVPGDEDMASAT